MEQNKKYLVSVVTPFHNVDMKYFSECVASMRRQTIGFENVQWIIVVHNCEPKYLPMLKEMFANDSNVVLEELNDEHRTPSSPRNRGLELVEAPYVGLLDGDDYYTDDCFEVVLKNAEETSAEMLCVRREQKLIGENVKKLNLQVLFNNTEYRNVQKHGHWDTDMMFDGAWGISTSYFFSSSMLSKHGLCFDVNVHFAEDYLFVLHCIAHANSVCYLNQYIGYIYVINDGSLVQSPNKPASTLLQYAKGYKTIFETMQKYGIDYSSLVLRHMTILSGFILHSKDMTIAIRQEIKDLLGQFVILSSQQTVNKLRTKEAADDALNFVRAIILDPENTLDILTHIELNGLKELIEILRENKDTDFAHRNNFGSISTLDAWQFRVPLTNAAFYKPMIDLQTKVGEKQILTNGATVIYLRTKTGNLLPCTEEHLRSYHNALNSIVEGHNNLLLSQSKPVEQITIDDAVVDTIDSATIKAYFKYHYIKNGMLTARLAAPVECYFTQNETDYREIALHALACSDVDQLVAGKCEEVVEFFRYIEQNWRDMLCEVKCSEVRRAELETIFALGFDIPVATKLWPNLQRSVAFGSGEHYEAFQQMKRYTGNLPHNHGYYFTEEAILGKAVADNSDLFECNKDGNFYELLSIADDSAPVFWTEVEMGKPYQLIVTNRAGLYRYTTDHFICPQKVELDSIEFTIY